MPDALKILLGAGLALAAGIWTQLFVAKQNELTQRIDELVKLIWEYADLSSRYWSGEFKKLDHNKTEARMVAMDHFIGSMISEMAATNGRFQMQGDLDRTRRRHHLEDRANLTGELVPSS